MSKSECPKTGKRQNPNFWWFEFQHVPISDVRALKLLGFICLNVGNPNNFHWILDVFCPKIEQTYYSWDFRRQKLLEIQTKLFGFQTLSEHWTVWNWAKSWMFFLFFSSFPISSSDHHPSVGALPYQGHIVHLALRKLASDTLLCGGLYP